MSKMTNACSSTFFGWWDQDTMLQTSLWFVVIIRRYRDGCWILAIIDVGVGKNYFEGEAGGPETVDSTVKNNIKIIHTKMSLFW
jgi:hypothetical protein